MELETADKKKKKGLWPFPLLHPPRKTRHNAKLHQPTKPTTKTPIIWDTEQPAHHNCPHLAHDATKPQIIPVCPSSYYPTRP